MSYWNRKLFQDNGLWHTPVATYAIAIGVIRRWWFRRISVNSIPTGNFFQTETKSHRSQLQQSPH